MSSHLDPPHIRARRSGALVLLLASLGAVIAVAVAMTASAGEHALVADGPSARTNVTQTDPGVVQPEPSAPQTPGRRLAPLVVGIVVLVSAAVTATAGFAVLSRRRRPQ